jgi:crossover junction endodeoxyribonuclease RuvC
MGIRATDFERMQERVARPKRAASPAVDRTASAAVGARHDVILGIDPSLRGTGYGVIQARGRTVHLVRQGTVRCPAGWERTRCLLRIAEELRDAVKATHPSVCVVEGLFYAQNFQTTLRMGEARGAALVIAAEAGMEVYEMAPRRVKQAIVGYGAAQKLAVAKMVQRLLRLEGLPEPDAADALALALAYAQEQGRFSLTPLKRI